jgi:hypothetical protein
MLSVLFDEPRRALRALAARPGFSARVVGVLASGLDCVISMVAMDRRLLVRALSFAQCERRRARAESDRSLALRMTRRRK